MRWSWRVARLFGIGVYVHVTFPLLLLWVGFAEFSAQHSWADALVAVGFVLILFGIVVLHELGHAITARRFGVQTRDITLLPIGGVARLDRIPENPKQELLIALAGPAVNVCLALFFFAVIGGGNELARLAHFEWPAGSFLPSLMWVNVGLAVFNLVPAFPMDGGRVLRALLATRVSYVRATSIAARIGKLMALVFGFVGMASFFGRPLGPFSNPFLVLIGVFVWLGASQEARLVQLKSALNGTLVGQVMISDFRALAVSDPLWQASALLLAGWQSDFPVLDQGRPVGLLTQSSLVNGLAQRGQVATVGEVMQRQISVIEPNDTAETGLMRLRTGGSPTMLVVHEGQLVGMLTVQNISEYLIIRAALNGASDGLAQPAERCAA
jgi:Zn-dependent protease/predicted transcriptional regulator